MMAVNRKNLVRAVAINLNQAFVGRDRAKEWNDRQKRFLAAAIGNATSKRQWFVIATDNRCEKSVYNRLLNANIQAWLPLHIEKGKRRKGGPRLEKEICVWPGYIFVNVVPIAESWAGISAVKNVKSILTDGEKPIALKDKEISKLIELVLSGDIQRNAKGDTAPYDVGDNVLVLDGPFALFNGIVQRCKADDDKVCIDVSIFGRSTPVWLGLDQIDRVR